MAGQPGYLCSMRAPDAEAGASEVGPVVEQLPPEQDAQRVQRHHALCRTLMSASDHMPAAGITRVKGNAHLGWPVIIGFADSHAGMSRLACSYRTRVAALPCCRV